MEESSKKHEIGRGSYGAQCEANDEPYFCCDEGWSQGLIYEGDPGCVNRAGGRPDNPLSTGALCSKAASRVAGCVRPALGNTSGPLLQHSLTLTPLEGSPIHLVQPNEITAAKWQCCGYCTAW